VQHHVAPYTKCSNRFRLPFPVSAQTLSRHSADHLKASGFRTRVAAAAAAGRKGPPLDSRPGGAERRSRSRRSVMPGERGDTGARSAAEGVEPQGLGERRAGALTADLAAEIEVDLCSVMLTKVAVL
jgi:hypothetical protein